MSSLSRRKKDLASGGTGKVSAAAAAVSPVSAKSVSTGKENSRPTSRVWAAAQKRSAGSTAQIDEPESTAVEEPRVRKGKYLAPRGRNSSPFEFSAALSNRRNSRVLERKVNNANELKGIDKFELAEGVNCGDDNEEGVSVRSCDREVRVSVDLVRNGEALDEQHGNYPGNAKKKIRIGGCGDAKLVGTLSSVVSRNAVDSDNCKKYASKLHAKLAFLEEKVKRIASDIEETKDMLDMENLDTSEMTLSDIREKIVGIERAMGNVGRDGNTEMGSVKSNENVIHDKSLVRNSKGDMLNVEKDEGVSLNVNVVADAEVSEVQEGEIVMVPTAGNSSLNMLSGKDDFDALLMADERLNDFDDHEKVLEPREEFEENYMYQLSDIGGKSSTAGWFVSEGESVILAHDDGSCSYYDIVNNEVKVEYKPPVGVSPNTWRDCWIIHTPGGDGCSGKYVVAASAGNSVDPGFCSWDFYTKDVRGFHIDDGIHPIRTALAPLPNDPMHRRNPPSSENQQWWYKPCGPLIISVASSQRIAQIYDIRDGDRLVKWELSRPMVSMDYASPLQWKSKGKVVIAELDGVSVWDVSTLTSRALQSVSSCGQTISALHVNNADAEQGGGVRKRISRPEAEGNDGVFCTPNSINVLDFRQPSGIGLKIPITRQNAAQSVFSCGDSIYIGFTSSSLVEKNHSSQIQQFSLRKNKLLSMYQLPESNAHHSFTALTQVWGNSSVVMGVCGLGLFAFDSFKDGTPQPATALNAKEVLGPDNMYSPSFDYLGSRVLLISRDRPACWKYLF